MSLLELVLSNTLTHRRRRAHTTAHHLQQVVNIVGSTPLLVRKNLDLVLRLGLLDDLAICAHALLGIRFGEGVGHERGLVQTREGDELPAVAESTQALDVSFLLIARHRALPIEGGGEVVSQSVK